MSNGLTLPFQGTVAGGLAFSITTTAGGIGVWGRATGNPPPPPKPPQQRPHFVLKAGVAGESDDGVGVSGTSHDGTGLSGSSQTGNGVEGGSITGGGVRGASSDGDGVLGYSESNSHAGVSATNDGGGVGLWAGGTPAGHFEGDVVINGNLATNGAATISGTLSLGSEGDIVLGDCAEQFDVVDAEIEPGTVMVIDQGSNLRSSDRPYDTRVAGVVSGAGEYRPAIILDRHMQSGGRVPIALFGRVYCKADAGYSPIGVGDLLTTSPTPGHAMRAADASRAFGAVIGKALRPLPSGTGLIPVLIALQ